MVKGLTLITEPASEPIALSDAKNFLKIDSGDTSDDTLIGFQIQAARRFCEEYTGLALIEQTWQFSMDQFPGGSRKSREWWDGTRDGSILLFSDSAAAIELPKSPASQIVSLTTYGTDETANTFDISLLNLDSDSKPGRIFLKFGQIWPVNLRPLNAVKVQFKAGFGTTATKIPQPIIGACYIMMAHFYENREPLEIGRFGEAPLSIRAMLDPFKVRKV